MPSESISALLRPGFPKESNDGKSNRTQLEYVGIETDLRAAVDGKMNAVWGSYAGIVIDVAVEPIENTVYAIMSITCELKLDQTFELSGTKQETTYEIDWVDVSKPLKEHREFAEGGAFELTDEDRIQIGFWENEQDPATKAVFGFTPPGGGSSEGLTPNATKYAQGLLLGIEYFTFKAPVARQSETWVNGPPPTSTAGIKEDPTGFPNLPTGYEWLKSADRSIRAGGQFRWDRSQEWIGAAKVLVDAEGIFY